MDAALAKKMMMEKFKSILVLNKPAESSEFEEVIYDTKPAGQYDLVAAFVFSLEEMRQVIFDVDQNKFLHESGHLYLMYPKKGNKKYDDYIDRDAIFPYLKVNDEDGQVSNTSLKFNKMIAFNEVFTLIGLKKIDSKQVSRNHPSGRVDDYVQFLPELRDLLQHKPDVLSMFDQLTLGYQKDWARFIFSTKSLPTKEKRLQEMHDILLAGGKSKEEYKKKKSKEQS